MFEHSVPGLPAAAAAEGLSPLEYMRRYGAFEIATGAGARHEDEIGAAELADIHVGAFGRVYTRFPGAARARTSSRSGPRSPTSEGRRPVGVRVDGVVRRGFPTPSGRLEFWSSTLAAWGWPEHALPGYIRSHVHPSELAADQMVLLSTFRLPTQIHTRSANSKWLDELAHANPVWIHPSDAARLEVARTGDLVRVETEIGHFVAKAWLTEAIRPGVVACSHHMGRWKLSEQQPGQSLAMATVTLQPGRRRLVHVAPRPASDRTTRPTRTRHASGGPTSPCTRTSPFPSSPTPSPACTAGIRRCGCVRRIRPISSATSLSTPTRRTRPTGGGSRRPGPPGRSLPTGHAGRRGSYDLSGRRRLAYLLPDGES